MFARQPAFRRQPVAEQARSVSQSKTFPAPTKGWVSNINLANAKPGMALVLENFFPTAKGIEPRGGSQKHATIGTDPVERVFHFTGPTGNKLFAADEENIFDVTSPADPDVAPSAAVTSQNSGYYSTSMFYTSGSAYLFAANGVDKLQRFDGSTWLQMDSGSSPAITGVDTADLASTWVYRNRVFFTHADQLTIHYLAVDSAAGALGTRSLSGIFKRGGQLLFGATWSRDSGDGLDDFCVVGTTEGELAIFQGGDPAGSDPGDFDLVGRYDISSPLGKNATMSAGGDLLIATEDGIVPVSEAIQKDSAALSLSAVTKPIEPDWQANVMERGNTPWEIAKWPSRNLAVVTLPAPTDGDDKYVFVVNIETGAWCKYTDWDARSIDIFNDRLMFGTRDGEVWEGETGGQDGDAPIYCTAVLHGDHLGMPGVTKTVMSMRSTFVAGMPFIPKLSCSVDYKVSVPAPPAVAGVEGPGWDLSVWDTDEWDDAAPTPTIETRWASIGVTGFSVNPQLQVTSNSEPKLDISLVALDLVYEVGGIMV